MKLSIIIPCKNEEGNIVQLYEKLKMVLNDIKYEAIFIDDGSTDRTMDKLNEIYNDDIQHVKVLSFSRNFKKEAAMLAGLQHSSGEYTCFIDADLQQNPKYLIEMYEFLENNKEYDEVAMVMKNKNHSNGFMNYCKESFYKLMNKLCDVKFEMAASDFRMFRKNVKDAMISFTENNRFTKGIFAWIGFNVKFLPYEVEPRTSGNSSFGFIPSVKYALEGIMAFSDKPLVFANWLGALTLFGDFIYLLILLIMVINGSLEWSAVHALILVILLMFGILFILIGILGSYIAKMSLEVKNRPMYIVKSKLGYNDDNIL